MKNADHPTIKCACCGVEFIKLFKHHKFCSPTCRSRADYRKRYADPAFKKRTIARVTKYIMDRRKRDDEFRLRCNENNRASKQRRDAAKLNRMPPPTGPGVGI